MYGGSAALRGKGLGRFRWPGIAGSSYCVVVRSRFACSSSIFSGFEALYISEVVRKQEAQILVETALDAATDIAVIATQQLEQQLSSPEIMSEA